MSRPVFRFAPSPNGRLHLGHALSAGFNAMLARRTGGRYLLRIENIDPSRAAPALEAALIDDLRWLGLSWEEPVRRQSEHFPRYAGLLDRLRREELVYPAFMSRGEIRAAVEEHERGGKAWPRNPDGAPLYPGRDRALGEAERAQRIGEGKPFTWRLDIEEASRRIGRPLFWREARGEDLRDWRENPARPELWGDVALASRDVPTSYHLAVVADDASQGVSHVVRGKDLFEATAVHRLLQELLGFTAPAYFHHRLILGADGRKLSKSEGARSIAAWRAEGAAPADVWEAVGLPPDEFRS
ncbi:MAG TPA: tRNA glutamyl-Q(34) synthetase GluQRS [Mesorhizobium sp.]|jgi:glutamyl-Q tRNA(Asp) synthetase|nr:tRNA glutamyl-Q(34) synthetase GluQRS [Mesorhizobium sp.]